MIEACAAESWARKGTREAGTRAVGVLFRKSSRYFVKPLQPLYRLERWLTLPNVASGPDEAAVYWTRPPRLAPQYGVTGGRDGTMESLKMSHRPSAREVAERDRY